MLIARQILLRPNTRQRRAMGQHAGYARWTYNSLRQRLSDAIDATPAGQFWPTIPALAKELRRERPAWATELSQNVFDNARRNLEIALRRWQDCRKGRHNWHAPGSCGFPKMHKRSANRNGFTASDGHPERNRIAKRKVYLPRIGWVRMAEDTPTDAPRQIHIKQVADRWFAVIIFDIGSELPDAPGGAPAIGVDVGIKTLAFTSDEQEYANPKALVGQQRKLRKLDKAIARSVNHHGKAASGRRKALYAKRAKLHAHIADIRRNAHRQTASAIAKTSGTVVVETLRISGMMRNRRLAKALADAGLGNLLRELAWQCAKRGVRLIEAGQRFASTQICARCGERPSQRIGLSERRYRCAHCGWEADRDYNASLNLKRLAPAFWESINGRGDSGSRRRKSARPSVKRQQGSDVQQRQPALIPGLAPA